MWWNNIILIQFRNIHIEVKSPLTIYLVTWMLSVSNRSILDLSQDSIKISCLSRIFFNGSKSERRTRVPKLYPLYSSRRAVSALSFFSFVHFGALVSALGSTPFTSSWQNKWEWKLIRISNIEYLQNFAAEISQALESHFYLQADGESRMYIY